MGSGVKLLLLALPLMLSLITALATSPGHKSFRVTPVFPDELETKCGLGGMHLALPRPALCASFCSQTPGCLLYCLRGLECLFFDAKTTPNWDGEVLSAHTVLTYDQCYSIWHEELDFSRHIVDTTSSSKMNTYRSAPKAFSGFVCYYTDYCFMSTNESTPWWRADLGAARTVATVRIQTRIQVWSIKTFYDVEVRFGTNSDYNINPTFGDPYVGYASLREVVTFSEAAPVIGRYLQVKTLSAVWRYLCICDIHILP